MLEWCDTSGLFKVSLCLNVSPEDAAVIFLQAGGEDIRQVRIVSIPQCLTCVALETVEHIPVF